MIKKVGISLTFFLLLIFFSGCSTSNTFIEVINYKYVETNEPILQSEIIKTWIFTDEKTVSDIVSALSDIRKANVLYDIAPPPYVFKVYIDNVLSKEYSIWLEVTKSIVWLDGDWYHLSEKSQKELKNILD
ncbi:hypothetical protein [Alkaliphilus peptidifermentans]|uniref:YhfM-like domain-containing protein n=1 Tax=Alkaliphilus peptidifermentans DSM 18978 TaxID=1120976 RepID=A0A1G5GYT2_9FIRM|nr:hypothetical protein [Alkaliphilus peptidifermentans]SCY56571.1 hypothetical protein SAMN03080606_01835 [Alkaliphilus peptidifermentans DSM 18978]